MWGERTPNVAVLEKGRRERRGGRKRQPHPHPTTTISWSKKLFLHVKLENINFVHANNIWGFSLFIEQDLSDKKYIVFSEFVVFSS